MEFVKISENLQVHQIFLLRRRNKKQLRINTKFAQRQGNGVDYGLFLAIPFAV